MQDIDIRRDLPKILRRVVWKRTGTIGGFWVRDVTDSLHTLEKLYRYNFTETILQLYFSPHLSNRLGFPLFAGIHPYQANFYVLCDDPSGDEIVFGSNRPYRQWDAPDFPDYDVPDLGFDSDDKLKYFDAMVTQQVQRLYPMHLAQLEIFFDSWLSELAELHKKHRRRLVMQVHQAQRQKHSIYERLEQDPEADLVFFQNLEKRRREQQQRAS